MAYHFPSLGLGKFIFTAFSANRRSPNDILAFGSYKTAEVAPHEIEESRAAYALHPSRGLRRTAAYRKRKTGRVGRRRTGWARKARSISHACRSNWAAVRDSMCGADAR